MLSFDASWRGSLPLPVYNFEVTFCADFGGWESFSVQVQATSYVEAALAAFATQPLMAQPVDRVCVALCESPFALLVIFTDCWEHEGVLHATYIHQFGVPVVNPGQASQVQYVRATSAKHVRFA
jgi:hypothetical protein